MTGLNDGPGGQSLPFGVAYRSMAVDAVEHVSPLLGRKHVIDESVVAFETSLLGDFTIARLDSQWIREIAGCESQRMKKSIVGLGDPFADRVRAQVAVVAGGDGVVA